MNHQAQAIIDALEMKPHPEGGYYTETYRSDEDIAHQALPERFPGDRALGTAIYFLLTSADISCFHRIRTDEIWHFYTGSPLDIHLLNTDGGYQKIRMGTDIANNERPQAVIPHGQWIGASVVEPDSFTLVGCTTCPGFEFDDFEMADRQCLLSNYPRHQGIIRRLTGRGGR
ncbi:MAG: cupin domain-containing protein [Thermodesulfobacteriota bacterium]|nr:cupin domain-containing protein [Thermodesulfobacteriota bacterium]